MRKIAIILCIFLAVALVAGCASSGGGDKAAVGDEEPVSVTVDEERDDHRDRGEPGGGPGGGGGGGRK